MGWPIGSPAADVSYYGVIKSQHFAQATNQAPVISSNGYVFTAVVVATAPSLVTNATVRQSNTGALRNLLPEPGGVVWRFEERFATAGALDAAYPAGNILNPVTYTVTMHTANDGVRSGNLNFLLLSYPTTPQISNLAAGQTIDTTADFTLRWNPLGGTVLDLVQVLVLDQASNGVFATEAPFQPGALNGTDTMAVIPADILPPAAVLSGHLAIARPGLPNTTYGTGLAALMRETVFPLGTRPLPVPPQLEALPLTGGRFQARLIGEPDRRYHFQASSDGGSWTELLVTNPPTGLTTLTDPEPAGLPQRFYRVRVGP